MIIFTILARNSSQVRSKELEERQRISKILKS